MRLGPKLQRPCVNLRIIYYTKIFMKASNGSTCHHSEQRWQLAVYVCLWPRRSSFEMVVEDIGPANNLMCKGRRTTVGTLVQLLPLQRFLQLFDVEPPAVAPCCRVGHRWSTFYRGPVTFWRLFWLNHLQSNSRITGSADLVDFITRRSPRRHGVSRKKSTFELLGLRGYYP